MKLILDGVELAEIDNSTFEVTQRVVEYEPSGVEGLLDVTAPICFDIETGPLSYDQLEAMMDPPVVKAFDETAVKVGNWKDEKKIAQKIVAAREAHAKEVEAKLAKYERDFFEKAALDPMRGRVLAIGYGQMGTGLQIIHGCDSETSLLEEFWRIAGRVMREGGRLVGFSNFNFDLPFCRRRAWLHGVKMPAEIIKGRYWDRSQVDLSEEWSCGKYKEFVKLEKVAKFFGVGEKAGEGAFFSEMWNGEREAALNYLFADIEMTVGVAKRLLPHLG